MISEVEVISRSLNFATLYGLQHSMESPQMLAGIIPLQRSSNQNETGACIAGGLLPKSANRENLPDCIKSMGLSQRVDMTISLFTMEMISADQSL